MDGILYVLWKFEIMSVGNWFLIILLQYNSVIFLPHALFHSLKCAVPRLVLIYFRSFNSQMLKTQKVSGTWIRTRDL